MHLCFYLISACFLVSPRARGATADVQEHFRLLVWGRQAPPFMARSAHQVNAMERDCLAFGLVKTWENKDVVKEAPDPGSERAVSFGGREVYSPSQSQCPGRHHTLKAKH